VVSSANSRAEPSRISRSRATTGLISFAAQPSQDASVSRPISIPCRARICDWRYSGRWSA
jgi:hypothetical protein